LKKVSKKQAKKENMIRRSSYSAIINELNDKMASFEISIDVRGKRAEEALSEIKKYIDEAILLSIKEVYILHGKGDGILRQIIREHLDTVEQIKQYRDQNLERGGSGITIVEFK